MDFAHFVWILAFFLRKTSTIHITNFCSGMPLRRVHELTFLWFGLPKPSSGLLELTSCLRSLGCDACEHVTSKPCGAICQFRTQRTTASQLQWLALFWVVRGSQRTRLSGGATGPSFQPDLPLRAEPPLNPFPWPDFDLVLTWFGPENGIRVQIRSKSGPKEGVGRSGWDCPCSSSESPDSWDFRSEKRLLAMLYRKRYHPNRNHYLLNSWNILLQPKRQR